MAPLAAFWQLHEKVKIMNKLFSDRRLLILLLPGIIFLSWLSPQASVNHHLVNTDSLVPMGICLENYKYPFEEHYIILHIQSRELKMEYMDIAPDHPNGKTVLLLHGKNFCGDYWGETAKALSGKGYRVIIPDQIGFGKSAKPDNLQYSFQQLALNTKMMRDACHSVCADVSSKSSKTRVGGSYWS
jgi:hypothetical protein